MELLLKAGKIFLTIFVLAGLIFGATQSQDVFLGWVMGLIGVINGVVLLSNVFKKK